jgi:hypothetical protein
LAAAPSNDTGAPVPLRGRFVELIAGIQLCHQPVVFRRATLFARWFDIAGHVFLPLSANISIVFRSKDAGYMLNPAQTALVKSKAVPLDRQFITIRYG